MTKQDAEKLIAAIRDMVDDRKCDHKFVGGHNCAKCGIHVDKLTKDLQGLKAESQVTPEMVTQLKTDMMAMCDNANKPSQESVQKLSKDLSSSLSDKTLSNQEKAQLAKDMQAVMTSANLNSDEVQAVKKDMQSILTASNVSKDDAKLIMSDVQAIITEIQKKAKPK